MTSLKGMGEFFWGKELEHVHDWVKMLGMAIKV
jgi:hypothetical protein